MSICGGASASLVFPAPTAVAAAFAGVVDGEEKERPHASGCRQKSARDQEVGSVGIPVHQKPPEHGRARPSKSCDGVDRVPPPSCGICCWWW